MKQSVQQLQKSLDTF